MLKHLLTSILLLLCFVSSAQSNYFPPKPEGYSEDKYRRGRIILENTYAQIENADNGIVYVDYWNMAVAYKNMGQPADSIFALLAKAKATDPAGLCRFLNYIHKQNEGIQNTGFYKALGDRYEGLLGDCPEEQISEEINLEEYAERGGYELALIKELDRIRKVDRKYRIDNKMEEQIPLDYQNQIDMEQIIQKYGYPGRSLSGDKFEHVGFLVIQHAPLDYQEKYLPLVYNAVLNDELTQNVCNMLIDRIYTKREGYQVFGSQQGVPFGTDEEIKKVKVKYPFNSKKKNR